jgi:hypothetical protein
MKQAYDLAERGLSFNEIGRRLDISRNTISNWLRDPARYSPYIDEVAMERCLQGDRKVFENLSMWELREFYERVRNRAEAEREYSGAVASNQDATVYSILGPMLGMTAGKLSDRVQAHMSRNT